MNAQARLSATLRAARDVIQDLPDKLYAMNDADVDSGIHIQPVIAAQQLISAAIQEAEGMYKLAGGAA